MHPDFYDGAADGEAAGRLPRRACCGPLGRDIDTDDWTWLCELAGQLLFWPPNVSGWDDTRWLDTSTDARPLAARRPTCSTTISLRRLGRRATAPPRPPRRRSNSALARLGLRRRCGPSTEHELLDFVERAPRN